MLTNKKTLIEKQKYYLNLTQRGDANVVAGIHSVIKGTRLGYTMLSHPNSIFNLIKSHLDQPFREWLEQNEQVKVTDFSALVKAHGKATLHNAYAFFSELGYQNHPGAIPNDPHWFDAPWRTDEFSKTIDCLISFLDFCSHFPSPTVKVVHTDPNPTQHGPDEAVERIGKGRKPKSRSESPDESIPGYLKSKLFRLRENEMCLACGRPVSNRDQRNSLIKSVAEIPVRNALKNNVQISSGKGRSLDYCVEHTQPGGGSAGKRKGTRWRIRFMSLLQSLEIKYVSFRIHSFLPSSFMLEFSCQAIRNGSSRRKLRIIESKLPLLIETTCEVEADAIGAEIAECIRAIYFEDLRLDHLQRTAPAHSFEDAGGIPSFISARVGLIQWPVGPAKGA